MHSTPGSLLERLRLPDQEAAWTQFVRLYTPLLYRWACRVGLQPQDAADLVQDVLTLLVQKLPQFSYDRDKSFRAWLRTVLLNKWRERCRRGVLPMADGRTLDQVAAPEDAEALWDADYRNHLVGQALRLMQADFQPTSWKACWEHVVGGKSAAAVAAELGLTPGAVRVAKFRVLSRLRQELAGLLD